MVTPMATMPTVEAMVLIAVIVCGDQKFAVWIVKKSTTAMQPEAGRQLAAPSSDSTSDLGDRMRGRGERPTRRMWS